jgi:hypothetical protein
LSSLSTLAERAASCFVLLAFLLSRLPDTKVQVCLKNG